MEKKNPNQEIAMSFKTSMFSKQLHTLCCLIAGLSAPSNNSAVALLKAAKPSIGRYCIAS